MANQNPQSENNRPNQNQNSGSQKPVREFPDMQSPNPTERDARDLQGQKGQLRDTSKRNASEVGEGEDYDEDMLSNVEEEDEKSNSRSDSSDRSSKRPN